MSLKRMVAFMVAAIMVFSVMPVVYAAELSDAFIMDYMRLLTTADFDANSPAPAAASDTAISTAWPSSGLTGIVKNGFINVAGGVNNPRIQSYSASSTNGGQVANIVSLPDYGVNDDALLVSFIAEYTCTWGDIAFYDTKGNIITAFRYGTGDGNTFSVEWGHTGWGNPYSFKDKSYSYSVEGAKAKIASGSTQVDVLIRNYSGYYTAAYYIDNELLTVVTYEGENVAGLSEIHMSRGSGGGYTRISLQNLKIYTITAPVQSDITTQFVTAYKLRNSIGTVTKGDTFNVPTSAKDPFGTEVSITWASEDESIIANDGSVAPVGEVTPVALDISTVVDGTDLSLPPVTINVFPKSYSEGDKISGAGNAYSVESQVDTSDIKWYLRKSSDGSHAVPGLKTVTQNGVTSYAFPPLGGAGSSATDGTVNARTSIAITPGKSYLLRFYYSGCALANGTSNAYNKVYTTKNAYNDEVAVNYVSGTATGSITTNANEWTKVEEIFTASDNANYLTFVYSWLNESLSVTDIELYEVKVDETVAENIEKVNLPEQIFAIGSNEPIIPTVTTVEGDLGSTVEAVIAWNNLPEEYEVGDNVIDGILTTAFGTSDEIKQNVSMTVTVLEETFALEDKASVNGQGAADKNLSNFPCAIADSFTVEMDITFESFGDLWVILKNRGYANFFGPEQVPVGIDAQGGFRPVNGDGAGSRAEADKTLVNLSTNVTYRLMIRASAGDDKYTVMLTGPDGKITTAKNYGFRTNADSITSLALLTNNGKGSVKATNIKVNSASVAAQMVDYTVNITGAGENNRSYTKKTVYSTDVELPYFEGYILKSRAVEGNVITLTYCEQTDTTGTWAVRNNTASDTPFNSMKFLGSHDSFTSNMELKAKNADTGAACYGDLAGIISAAVAIEYEKIFFTENGADGYTEDEIATYAEYGNMVYNMSRAQSADVYDQLSAGVRYFDARLSRQDNGEFWTRHGLLSDAFRDVATTIAQFAKENPGEVIVLDFQSMYDALYLNPVTNNNAQYGADAGDDNKGAYEALWALLEETGIAEYVVGNIKLETTYEELTENGTKTAIVCFSKARGSNCISQFINRNTIDADTYHEVSEYPSVVDGINNSYPLAGDHSFNIIHAYATSPTLIEGENGARSNNPRFVEEANFEKWMMSANVLLMDDVVSDATTYLALLQQYNRDGFDRKYSNTVNEVEVEGITASIPFSTKLAVEKNDALSDEAIVVNGMSCNVISEYDIELLQFDKNSVSPSDEIKITFPHVSEEDGFIDVLLNEKNEIVAVAAEGEEISVTTSETGRFFLATAQAAYVNFTVNYNLDGEVVYADSREYLVGQDAYSFSASEGFYIKLGNKAYIVSCEEEQRFTVSADSEGKESTVHLSVVSDNAVLSDTFGNTAGSVTNNIVDMLFVGSSGVSDAPDFDDDGNATFVGESSNVGSARIPLLTFNVPKVDESKAVKLNVYVGKANQNLSSGATVKLAVNSVDFEANEEIGYYPADYCDVNNIIWSDNFFAMDGYSDGNGRFGVDEWVSFDVTELVEKADGDTITFTLYAPTAAAYVVDREKAVNGGEYEGKAAYLDVVDAHTISVEDAYKVTKMGTLVDNAEKITVPADATVIMYTNINPLFTDGVEVYKANTPTTIDADGEIYSVGLGISMVDGAQIRIGNGVDENGKIDSESGIRFITTVDYNESVAANEDAQFGVMMKAEDSDKSVDIPTTYWQTDTTFSTALTNIGENNYNRVYTATPYVIVDGQKFEGAPVSRSIYQVAQGLLETDEEIQDYTASEMLVKVLNAYVNQVGIRLTLSNTGFFSRISGEGAYTGRGAFFSVGETQVNDNVYTVTLIPIGAQTKIDMNSWNTYIRINNNNSKIKVATALTENEDGTYTLTFDLNSVE